MVIKQKIIKFVDLKYNYHHPKVRQLNNIQKTHVNLLINMCFLLVSYLNMTN